MHLLIFLRGGEEFVTGQMTVGYVSLMDQHRYGSDITISLVTVRYCDDVSDSLHSIECMHSAVLIILEIGLTSSVESRRLLRDTLRCHLYPSVTVLIFYFEGEWGRRSTESF